MKPKIDDPLTTAAIDLIGRTGAESFQIRYDEEQDPIVWVAVASYRVNNAGKRVKHGRTVVHEAAAALAPTNAILRLADTLIDGAMCAHCRRPSGVTKDWEGEMPLSNLVCWYRYDPELKTFRRGCEGET